MRLWGRRTDDEDDAGSHERKRAHGGLVGALVESFDPDAAVALVAKDWEPSTDEERIALIIAMDTYRDLVPFGDRCIEAVQRSAHRHEWCAGLLLTLARIGTLRAVACLQEGMRARWRNGSWDRDCAQMLTMPYGRAAMALELQTSFDPRVARLLTDAGWLPANARERAALLIALGDIAGTVECGPEAVPSLTAALARGDNALETLEALALIGTDEACQVVIESIRSGWEKGRSRWSDADLILQCGTRAVPPLVRWIQSDPAHASILVDLLVRFMDASEALDTDALSAVAAMPDARHVYYVPEDPRGYVQTLDCSELRRRASAVLAGRESLVVGESSSS